MRVNVYLEERFYLFDGVYYSQIYNNDFWGRYLSVFSCINVVARVKMIESLCDLPNGYKANSFNNITFLSLPDYKGLLLGLMSLPYVFFRLFFIVWKSDRNILRLPGVISIVAGFFSVLFKKRFAVELVGDPYEVFSTGIGGKLSRLLRFVFTLSTKKIISKSNAVAYVTKEKMQKRYPSSSVAFTTHYSSIILDKSFILSDRSINKIVDDNDFYILLVGSLEQRYKGFDLVFYAYSKIRNKFDNIKILVIGDGCYKEELEYLAAELRIKQNVSFLGKVSREEVFVYMDNSDLFIMPSRTEGLPRALIEAMARGMPAIGSDVGGIPELLSCDFLFEKENINDLAELLDKIIPNYALRSKMSQLNLNAAQDYRSDLLEIRRNRFYSYLASE